MKQVRQWRLAQFKKITRDYGMSVHWLSPYHARVESKMDIWPTSLKYQLLREDGSVIKGIYKLKEFEELLTILNY